MTVTACWRCRDARRARELGKTIAGSVGLPLTEFNASSTPFLSTCQHRRRRRNWLCGLWIVGAIGTLMLANILRRSMPRPSTLQRTRSVLQHMQQSTSAPQKAEVSFALHGACDTGSAALMFTFVIGIGLV